MKKYLFLAGMIGSAILTGFEIDQHSAAIAFGAVPTFFVCMVLMLGAIDSDL